MFTATVVTDLTGVTVNFSEIVFAAEGLN